MARRVPVRPCGVLLHRFSAGAKGIACALGRPPNRKDHTGILRNESQLLRPHPGSICPEDHIPLPGNRSRCEVGFQQTRREGGGRTVHSGERGPLQGRSRAAASDVLHQPRRSGRTMTGLPYARLQTGRGVFIVRQLSRQHLVAKLPGMLYLSRDICLILGPEF